MTEFIKPMISENVLSAIKNAFNITFLNLSQQYETWSDNKSYSFY